MADPEAHVLIVDPTDLEIRKTQLGRAKRYPHASATVVPPGAPPQQADARLTQERATPSALTYALRTWRVPVTDGGKMNCPGTSRGVPPCQYNGAGRTTEAAGHSSTGGWGLAEAAGAGCSPTLSRPDSVTILRDWGGCAQRDLNPQPSASKADALSS